MDQFETQASIQQIRVHKNHTSVKKACHFCKMYNSLINEIQLSRITSCIMRGPRNLSYENDETRTFYRHGQI